MSYAVELSLFIVLASLAFLLFLFLFLYHPVKDALYDKRTIEMYYKKVRRVALDGDYYLINAFANKTADEEEFHIDHILVGDKFVYCIRDRYYDGVVQAKAQDPSWVFYHHKKADTIRNPMRINEIRVQRMALMTGFDPKYFISVVLVNNDCLISPLGDTGSDNYLVSLKNFPKFIAEHEALPVPKMDPQSLAVAVKDIAELNLNGKEQ